MQDAFSLRPLLSTSSESHEHGPQPSTTACHRVTATHEARAEGRCAALPVVAPACDSAGTPAAALVAAAALSVTVTMAAPSESDTLPKGHAGTPPVAERALTPPA
jgi:hypothetical protein